MKVSIIIPTYNEEKRLPECLDSIFDLDYSKEDIEVIVVDNGSTDGTREIAKSCGAEVLRDDSLNVSGLRNLGASQAKGDILAFVDADCIVSKDWLKNASKYSDDITVAAWGAPPAIPKEATWVQRTWYLVRQKENQVQTVDWLETMNLLVRKDQFLSIGGFNEALITCEDVDFSYRISRYGQIVSDKRIEVIHLGEASTLQEFVRKEIWRGRSNLRGIFSHGLSLKEIPSLSIPLYFGVLLPMFFLGFLVSLNPTWLLTGLLIYLLPSAAVILKVKSKRIGPAAMVRLLVLIQLYFFSRTIAVFKRV
jgi:glycosyltransferase involved in cell wall biosynthesis